MQNPTFIIAVVWLALIAPPTSSHEKMSHSSMASELRQSAVTEDADCKWTAKNGKRNKPQSKQSGYPFQLDVGGFVVNIPPGATRFSLTEQGLLIVYPKKAALILSTNIVPSNFGLSTYSNRANKISAADVANVMFMKTHCDDVPEHEDDALIWNYALSQKGFYFKDAKTITKTESDKLVYYLSDSAAPPSYSGQAIVTNPKFKHSVLVMSAVRIPFDEFKKIALSVTWWEQ